MSNSAPYLSKEPDALFDHTVPRSHKDQSFGDHRAVLIQSAIKIVVVVVVGSLHVHLVLIKELSART